MSELARNKRYRRTFGGMVVGMYQRMKSRTIWNKAPSYYHGLPLLERTEFYQFAKSNEHLKDLYSIWQESGYLRKLAPSVNRINSKQGYLLTNIEFIQAVENSRLGGYGKRGYRKWSDCH